MEQNLDFKLTRIENVVSTIRTEFNMQDAPIEVAADRAIQGPDALECMSIYDLLDGKKSIKDIQYSEEYGCDVIDKTSFQIFNGYPQQLGSLKSTNVFLEIDSEYYIFAHI